MARTETTIDEALRAINPPPAVAGQLRGLSTWPGVVARLRDDHSHAYIAPASDALAALEFSRTWIRCAVSPDTADRFLASYPGVFAEHVRNGDAVSLQIGADDLLDEENQDAVEALVEKAMAFRLKGGADARIGGERRRRPHRTGDICPEHHLKMALNGLCPDCD